MSNFRQQPTSYWVALLAVTIMGLLFFSDVVFDWAPRWLGLLVWLTILASSIYSFRMRWKQTDHPAFHPNQQSAGTETRAPDEPNADRQA
jgi:UDP-N-acetylmuramyl pentapeptide phosphotransferase/UDP-N-acetylglucosamine-1-phosphate transferase